MDHETLSPKKPVSRVVEACFVGDIKQAPLAPSRAPIQFGHIVRQRGSAYVVVSGFSTLKKT